MPRIKDAYLDCVVYLYPSEVDADDGTKIGGSGFLVGVPTKELRQDAFFLYAVTNKHIADKYRTVRMNTRDGQKFILPTTRFSWVDHPDGDDISACLVYFDPKEIRFNHVHRDMFLSKDIISRFNIGPGDDCFMVGRFVNHEGRQQNLPTVRFGNIGQMPWEPIRQDDGFEQESFLVECRSIGGYSGSPIFVHIPIFSEREGVENWYPHPFIIQRNVPTHDARVSFGSLKAHGPWLLGVDWGHLNQWEPVRDEFERPVNRGSGKTQVRLNTGMAGVVPAWKLAELLDTPQLTDYRSATELQLKEAEPKEPLSPATMDGR